MILECFPYSSKPCSRNIPLSSSTTGFISICNVPICIGSGTLKLSTPRLGRVTSAVVSDRDAVGSSFSGIDVFKLTYLEGNCWLWEVGGLKILVDPKLWYSFALRCCQEVLEEFPVQLSELPEVNCLLITQNFDDHCHLKTLKPLFAMYPDLRVISTPNAKEMLDPLFSNVTYLEPGQISSIDGGNGSKVRIQATAGPVLGPPWQLLVKRYLVISPQGLLRLYYEPRCVYNENLLEKEHADIVITPVIKQLLPYFTLVSGQEDAVKLAKLLYAKFIVLMKNGDLDSKGFLASMVWSEGTVESLEELLYKELPDSQILEPTPGVPL